jgi:DNA polymerase-1
MGRLLLIDGHNLAYRAYHALPPFTAPDGHPSGAITGTVNVLLSVLERERPSHAMVALDGPEGSWRKGVRPTYKAGRAKADGSLIDQLIALPGIFPPFGIPVEARPGEEADDLIAGAARLAEAAGLEVRILSSDRDLWALASERVTILVPAPKGTFKEMTPAAVETELGVAPDVVPSWKALVGDSSDNLPGVPGVGPKTAAALLTGRTLDELLADPRGAGATERIAAVLTDFADQAREIKRLATLGNPTDINIAAAKLGGHSRAHLEHLVARWGLRRIEAKLDEITALLDGCAALD